MTDYTKLRQLAQAARSDRWWTLEHLESGVSGEGMPTADAAYIAAASPDCILALLDERDRLNALCSEQAARWAPVAKRLAATEAEAARLRREKERIYMALREVDRVNAQHSYDEITALHALSAIEEVVDAALAEQKEPSDG